MTSASFPPATGEPMRTVLPADRDTRDLYFLLNSLVVPRPIAWVSTTNADGVVNLAPHSYFTVVASDPPAVGFTSIGDKDTVTNIRAAGEFIVHVAGHDLVERVNHSSADAPADVSEVELVGMTTVPGACVDVPRVVGVPVAIECELEQIVELGNGRFVIGRCIAFHVAERLWDERDRVDPAQLDAVGRMGGSTYCTTRDRFELRRPAWADITRA